MLTTPYGVMNLIYNLIYALLLPLGLRSHTPCPSILPWLNDLTDLPVTLTPPKTLQ